MHNCFLLFLVVFSTAYTNATNNLLCNSYKPGCGLTSEQARKKFLTPYSQIFPKLRAIKKASKVAVQIGPLIKKKKSNWGIFNIDKQLDLGLTPAVNISICGKGTTPSIRKAIICSVSNDNIVQPARGNLDGNKIGFSNQGRRIYAARLGNRVGVRVLITTQLHGNEPAGTEAAFKLLTSLTRDMSFAKPLLNYLDIAIVFRVNPDAGEPTGTFPSIGVPFMGRTGFHRQNIDSKAGGGFVFATEPGFFGVVGRGYDLNRYNYAGFYDAIRPVESQALVGTLHAFRPHFVYDLHGDLPKVICAPNVSSIRPNIVFGSVPTFECLPSAPKVPSLATSRKNMVVSSFFGDDVSILDGPGSDFLTSAPSYPRDVRMTRSVLGILNNQLKPKISGFISRYSFPSPARTATTLFSDGTLDRGSMRLGAVGSGWEVLNFVPQLRPAVDTLDVLLDGTKVPNFGADSTDLNACFTQDNICLHVQLLRRTLLTVNKLTLQERLLGDNGFCNIPTDDGVVSDFPSESGFGNFSTSGPVMVPQGGKFGVPSEISGVCAGDLV